MRKVFSGRYYKCQTDAQTLAVISASHGNSRSVQLITDDDSWNFTENPDKCHFSDAGFTLDLEENGVAVKGQVTFSDLTPLKYDIMGPFRYVPFMQCRHSVDSMHHWVNGTVTVNGKEYVFQNAHGYIEGDRGYSFPKEYVWTHTFFDGGSLMLSAAHIPFGIFHFTGIISVLCWQGKEYRFATYLGARPVRIGQNEAVIRQGGYTLTAKLIEKNALPLAAPVSGDMVRTIHESASCRAAYRLEKDGKTLLEFETDRASFEFEYQS